MVWFCDDDVVVLVLDGVVLLRLEAVDEER